MCYIEGVLLVMVMVGLEMVAMVVLMLFWDTMEELTVVMARIKVLLVMCACDDDGSGGGGV